MTLGGRCGWCAGAKQDTSHSPPRCPPKRCDNPRRQLGFYNRRAEDWWRLREALDSGQEFGSSLALPPDASIKLTSPHHGGR